MKYLIPTIQANTLSGNPHFTKHKMNRAEEEKIKIRKQSTSNEKGAQFRHLFYAHIQRDGMQSERKRQRERE